MKRALGKGNSCNRKEGKGAQGVQEKIHEVLKSVNLNKETITCSLSLISYTMNVGNIPEIEVPVSYQKNVNIHIILQ